MPFAWTSIFIPDSALFFTSPLVGSLALVLVLVRIERWRMKNGKTGTAGEVVVKNASRMAWASIIALIVTVLVIAAFFGLGIWVLRTWL